MKKLSTLFWILAGILSHVMCAVVAYNYGRMQEGIEYGYSAPAWVAFLLVIPYSIGIAVCILLALYFRKKARQV